MKPTPKNAADAYRSTGNYAAVSYADPHTLICRLLDGALERVAQAKGAMQQDLTAEKGQLIGKAIAIIGGLHGCLDMEQGGEISRNLADLYEYMNLRLAEANIGDDIAPLDEVLALLGEIRGAWASIGTPEQQAG